MSWVTKFAAWKEAGKTTDWLTSRATVLFTSGYINQAELDEILAIVNAT